MKLNLFCCTVILCIQCLVVKTQTTFQKAYGGTSVDGAWNVQQTSDGGYIFTAEEQSFQGYDAVYNVKTNSVGDTIWTKNFGMYGPVSNYGNMVQETNDGGFITVGLAQTSSGDFYLLKTGSKGNLKWSKTFGGGGYEEGFSIQQTSDLGYIMAGISNSYGAGQADTYLVKTDSLGNLLWSKTFGGAGNEGISGFGNISVQQTPDKGYILAGYTNSFGAGNYDFYLIKTDSTGSLVWSKTIGGTGLEYGYGSSIGQTSDGGYMIVGLTNSFGVGMSDVYLIHTDGNGNLLWSRTYGGASDDYGYSVQQNAVGEFIITGATRSFGAGGFDVYLIKTDFGGNMIWSKTFGGLSDDYGYCVQPTTDGGYVITGYTYSFGAGMSDVYLVKTDANGNTGCNQSSAATMTTIPVTTVITPSTIVSSGCVVTSPATIKGYGTIKTSLCLATGIQSPNNSGNGISISPNPFSASAILKTDLELMNATAIIEDVFGKTIRTLQVNGQELKIERDDLPDGVYFIRVEQNNISISKNKLVITGQ